MSEPERRWEVEWLSAAWEGLDEIRDDHGDDAYDEALGEVLSLGDEPIPPDATEMRRARDYYRIYVYRSMYRAIYRVIESRRLILVDVIGPRDSVYSGWERW